MFANPREGSRKRYEQRLFDTDSYANSISLNAGKERYTSKYRSTSASGTPGAVPLARIRSEDAVQVSRLSRGPLRRLLVYAPSNL